MGCCQSRRRVMDHKRDQECVLIVGERGSGKTTIFFQLTDHPQFKRPVPTINLNTEKILYSGKSITLIDVGCSNNQVDPLFTYLSQTKGIIFVVDGAQNNELANQGKKFRGICILTRVPILIFLNKQDINKVSQADIAKEFELNLLQQPFKVIPCNGVQGQGVAQGFQWLFKVAFKQK